jgi:hypothetical protein
MDEAIKKKWVKALRSGKYKQGRDQFYDGYAHCCLAVLAEVITGDCMSVERNGGLSPKFRKQIGMSVAEQDAFIELNDESHDATFDQIAYCVENL